MDDAKPGDGTLTYKNKVLLLISVITIIRLFIAGIIDLGTDESYYWLYSQDLKWNYFDHPPMVAIWIRLFTANLSLPQSEFFLRLGSIAGAALSTWFMYKTVSVLHSQRAGWFAAIFYNASFYAGITTGLFIMPDSPQMVFWTLSLWMLARIYVDEMKWMNWITFGIVSGLCIMSKVHGAFIWTGLILFCLIYKRRWFLNPRFYISALLCVLISSPILIWNIQNHFVAYHFHIHRVIPENFSVKLNGFRSEVIGQLVINNPFNIALIAIALLASFKKKVNRVESLTIYNFIAIPLLISVLFISLYTPTFPHWSGPAYITLIPLAAIHLSAKRKDEVLPAVLKFSIGTYLTFLLACVLVIKYYPGNFGNKTNENLEKVISRLI